jgi:hypothetical protein
MAKAAKTANWPSSQALPAWRKYGVKPSGQLVPKISRLLHVTADEVHCSSPGIVV